VQPVPRIANGSRISFLSGLVTIESGMIALIDLPNLLSAQIEGEDAADAPLFSSVRRCNSAGFTFRPRLRLRLSTQFHKYGDVFCGR
jgi:hypothetical protein